MLFNSVNFVIFLAVVLVVYHSLARFRSAQNLVILIASYVFYGCWDWRFLSLIGSPRSSTSTSAWIARSTDIDRRTPAPDICARRNLGILGFTSSTSTSSRTASSRCWRRPAVERRPATLPRSCCRWASRSTRSRRRLYRRRLHRRLQPAESDDGLRAVHLAFPASHRRPDPAAGASAAAGAGGAASDGTQVFDGLC